MGEIEVNEYVRTDKGYIFKVDEEKKNLQVANFLDVEYGKIVNHSKQLIDLIEVGDYVNGYKVIDIMEDMETGEIHLEMTSDYTNEIIGDCTIYNDDIKSIVTKGMFKNAEYRMET
jgi:hypothetical protein